MPPLLVERSVRSRFQADLGRAMGGFRDAHPDCVVRIDRATGLAVLQAGDERRLDDLVGRLRTEFGLSLDLGPVQVIYRQAISDRVECRYTHKKQTGGAGEFADVSLKIEPSAAGSGPGFVSEMIDGALPGEFIAAIAQVVEERSSADFKVRLVDGRYHDTDSTAQTFRIAAQMALQSALEKARPLQLEPVMKVEVTVDDHNLDALIGDLARRRGVVTGRRDCDAIVVIEATVPLSELLGYHPSGGFVMVFDHYAPIPAPDDDPPFRPAIGMRA